MGADIHVFTHVANLGIVDCLTPFCNRNYAKFAFLGGVRNYANVTEMPWWNRGWPKHVELNAAYYEDDHHLTWVYLDELLAFDYTQMMENRRIQAEIGPGIYDGAAIAEPGDGKMVSYADFVDPTFHEDLAILKVVQDKFGKVTIAYGFDS